MRRPLSVAIAALFVPAVALAALPGATPAVADGPGVGTPWVVSLGDSYISGEAGRWAGNSNNSSASVDAGGPTAYLDNGGTSETIAGCHRSTAAEIHIGTDANGTAVNSLNLACSGARTATTVSGDGSYKPGIDFYNSGGRLGQALMLQQFAAANNVRMVVLSIGGNNFNFATIVQRCVTNFLTSSSLFPNYCYDDSIVSSNFTTSNITAQTNAIKAAIDNVKRAMSNAGYSTSQYTVVVQTYPSPIPNGAGFRYSQSGFTRQSTGGCGFWNRDADWANATALPRINGAVVNAANAANTAGNVRVMNIASALNGRRLCENTVKLMESTGLGTWTATGAADATEWVAQIRTLSTVGGPYSVQESLHPNWWGQKAVRNCVRQAWNNGSPRGGTCTRSGLGLNTRGEPVMSLA
ncbi:MAG: hypothetical protein ACKOAZ_10315 [Ilumatobacteraceae bacterium]